MTLFYVLKQWHGLIDSAYFGTIDDIAITPIIPPILVKCDILQAAQVFDVPGDSLNGNVKLVSKILLIEVQPQHRIIIRTILVQLSEFVIMGDKVFKNQ